MDSHQKALDTFHQACVPYGILASTENYEHYKRIWTRDHVISGLGSLIINDEKGITAFKNGLEFIAEHQSSEGLIPSNISPTGKVSYGTLTGKTDVLSWFIIGVLKYVQITEDHDFFEKHKESISKALNRMEAYEFNNRGLMYVPLDSNWADEYIFSGYVLFDNVLRYWAYLLLYAQTHSTNYCDKIALLKPLIQANFQKAMAQNSDIYHWRLNQQIPEFPYLIAAFNPARNFNYYDTFANALALISGLVSDLNPHYDYSEKLRISNPHDLIPAHFPVVHTTDADWQLLENNFLHHFENEPYCYHNGGLWPMLQMFYSFGLLKSQKTKEISAISKEVNLLNSKNKHEFREYYHAITGEGKGVKNCTWNVVAQMVLEQLPSRSFSVLFKEF